MTSEMPPRFADTLLRLLLAPRDRETVSGDVLEEYREVIFPARGRFRADLWFVLQVAGLLWRRNLLWAVLLSGSFIARTAYDWLLPTTNFYSRSMVSTFFAAGIMVCAGFWTAWRSDSLWTGALAGIATTLSAACISILGVASLLFIYHDRQTIAAIQGSGGLQEAFVLPVMLVVPGLFLGAVGGFCGGAIRRFKRLV